MSLHERVATLEGDSPKMAGSARARAVRKRIDGAAAVETGEITIALAAMLAYPTGITTALDISHMRAPAGESVAGGAWRERRLP